MTKPGMTDESTGTAPTTAATTAARVLDGRALSERVLDGLARRAAALAPAGVIPCLGVVLVGDDPASAVYVKAKTKAAAKIGVRTVDHHLPATASTAEVVAVVAALDVDPTVDGILVQLPLPKGIDEAAVLAAVSARKDVDGFHPENLGLLLVGRPRFVACTPRGCMHLLAESGVALAGKRAVVIGRSTTVGKPMAQLLLAADCTVTMAHSRTRDLASVLADAEIVVAAVGREGLVRGEWIRPGAVVIDVGINRGADGKLRGDVDYEPAAARASAITPVPGGVGPMTIACLMENVVEAAEMRAQAATHGG